jgi:phage shock protein PspC (stress-responsive transcriptional regulator)
MVCRTCANKVDDHDQICSVCGFNPLLGVDYCPKCSKETHLREVLCYKCGSNLTKSKALAREYNTLVAYKKLYRSADDKYVLGTIAGICHRYKLDRRYVISAIVLVPLIKMYLIFAFLTLYLLSWYLPELPTQNLASVKPHSESQKNRM